MDKWKSGAMILALLFLGFVAYTKFSIPLTNSAFTPDGLYRSGNSGSTIDPKEYYKKINGLVYSDNDKEACNTTVKSFPNPKLLLAGGSTYLPAPLDHEIKDLTEATTLVGNECAGLFKDGKEIIMPIGNYVFKNSNKVNSTLVDDTAGRRDIEIMNPTGDFIIVFEDVTTWWCHAHNTKEPIAHDKSVGANSHTIESVPAGFVIGVSKATTKMKVYHVLPDSKLKAQDVKSLDQLEQVVAIDFLKDGSIKVIPAT